MFSPITGCVGTIREERTLRANSLVESFVILGFPTSHEADFADATDQRLLLEAKRTSQIEAAMSAFDPKRT